MIKKSAIFLIINLCYPFCLLGQTDKPALDFSSADSVAFNLKYNGDILSLTKQLTNSFPDAALKARAIFRWITANIAYDCKYYNKYGYQGKEPSTYKCGNDSTECDIKRQVWETTYINHVLDGKMGVCQGYAMLFKKMCNIAGIESAIIPGYVRTEYYEVGTSGNLDHAWNAVLLNGIYYLVDVTWASGGCSKDNDGKLLKFTKHYNDYYWLTPPLDFSRNHFPEDVKWTLIKNYSKEKFSLNPYYDPGVISNIKLIKPASGIVHVKRGDTLQFRVIYTGQFKDLQINTNAFQNPDIWAEQYVTKHKTIKVLDTFAIKRQQYIKYKQNDGAYEFAYVVKVNNLDYLDILFDRRRIMRFKLTYR